MLVHFEGVALDDAAFEPMHGQVHASELGVGVALFLAPEAHALVRAGVQGFFNEVAGLHKHAGRAARGVVNDAVIGFDVVDDGAYQRGRCEEFAAFLRAGLGELVEEVFVDPTEHVATGLGQRWAVENLDQLAQQGGLEAQVFLGEGARQHLLAFAVFH